jgi:extradiol dioxygenase family protein
VNDLQASRDFYGALLGCPEGRSSNEWIDYDFFGHQLVCHLDKRQTSERTATTNLVDGHGVPVPHFGVVLDLAAWEQIRTRLEQAGMEFVMQPTVRFRGQVGEQATMFFRDPSGNNLEIKAFADLSQLFAR